MTMKQLLVTLLLIGSTVNAHVLTDLQNEKITIEQTNQDNTMIQRQVQAGGIVGSLFGFISGAIGSALIDESKRNSVAFAARRLAGLKQQEIAMIIAATTIGGYYVGKYFATAAWENYKAKNIELQNVLLNAQYRSGTLLDLGLRTASIEDFILHARVEYVDHQFPLIMVRTELEAIKAYFDSAYILLQEVLTLHPEATSESVYKKLEEYQLRIEVTNRAVRQLLAELKATEAYRIESHEYRNYQERQAQMQREQSLAQAQINAQNAAAHAAQAQAAAAQAQSDREWREFWFGKPAAQVNVNHNYRR